MISSRLLIRASVAVLALPVTLLAQLDEEDFPPGLLATYSLADRRVERVDADIAFAWDEASPDPRLPAGEFEASWAGRLLFRRPSDYRFHAHLQGRATVEIDGIEVLNGSQATPGWISGTPIALEFGEKELVVRFRKTEKSASLRLYWSSSQFPLEPLPDHLLFREAPRTELAQLVRGEAEYAAFRCNGCHRRDREPTPLSAPALTHVGSGVRYDWIVEKVRSPQTTPDGSRMPAFGFTASDASAIAAFLLHSSQEVPIGQLGEVDEPAKDRRQGELLTRSLGCLACHQIERLGQNGPYGGGDLSSIGDKRNADWIATWLSEPAGLNLDHRMPVFKLNDEERRQMAIYLAGLGVDQKRNHAAHSRNVESQLIEPFDPEVVARGRKLVEAARCAACHRIPGVEYRHSAIGELSEPTDGWDRSCLAETPDTGSFRPSYRNVDRAAIKAYLNSRTGTPAAESEFERGRRLLLQRGCVSCHERGATQGIAGSAGHVSRVDDELKGQSEALIPPPLTAVGDKLRDEALRKAISGEQEQIRLPWLHVRMPRFRHSDAEKSALVKYLVSHDRIPDRAPADFETDAESSFGMDDANLLVTAHTLVGAKGFSCIACHRLGRFEPKNVSLGARGSDLAMPGERMRKSFFLRWTRSPLRIVPGVEMPSYMKAVPGLLDERVDAQLAAVWDGLNDPRFQAPTDPSAVEQLLFVEPHQPARIVRDVFTRSDGDGELPVSRALAIGLNNGHNVLFDLDRFAVSQWTFGDFARQRTIGKSWYWDLAGVPLVSGFRMDTDLLLKPSDRTDSSPVLPTFTNGTAGRLLAYRPTGDGVQFSYTLDFDLGTVQHAISVSETTIPLSLEDATSQAGWERRIEAAAVPAGFDVLFRKPTVKSVLGKTTIAVVDAQDAGQQRANGAELARIEDSSTVPPFLKMPFDPASGSATLRLRYLSSVERPATRLTIKPPPPVPLESVTSTPGFDGVRLPLIPTIMPTALTWTGSGTLAFTSLKGHVYLAHDSNGDGIEDKLSVVEEGLAAPFGIIADGDDFIVAHKPELIRLRDSDRDGRTDERIVLATGWGYTDNYHDWTCGIVRDAQRNLYVGLGSDYTQRDRPRKKSRWRGKVLQISPTGRVTPIGHSFRYPTGLAIDPVGRIFVTDNQGVQNPFNEINHLVPGRHYGIPSRHEDDSESKHSPPAIQVPHPWTRSVNGIFFLPDDYADGRLAGHGIGCEFNGRFLIRFTIQEVGDVVQGATYGFSRPDAGTGGDNFLGPMCGGLSPEGDIYVGSLHDSGWLGGRNTGGIVRLRFNGLLPNGIRELRANSEGFDIEFFSALDRDAAAQPENYSISGYTRVWQGGYATPDSSRHQLPIAAVDVSEDRTRVKLKVNGLREGYVYEVTCDKIGRPPQPELWPATAHYTLHRMPPKAHP